MPAAEAAADLIYISVPHDSSADSPGAAIMRIVRLAIILAILSPFFALFVWFVWRRYSGAQHLFWFSGTRPILWCVFGGLLQSRCLDFSSSVGLRMFLGLRMGCS